MCPTKNYRSIGLPYDFDFNLESEKQIPVQSSTTINTPVPAPAKIKLKCLVTDFKMPHRLYDKNGRRYFGRFRKERFDAYLSAKHVPVWINHWNNTTVGEVVSFDISGTNVTAILEIENPRLGEHMRHIITQTLRSGDQGIIRRYKYHPGLLKMDDIKMLRHVMCGIGVSHGIEYDPKDNGDIAEIREISLCIGVDPLCPPTKGSLQILPDDAPST